MATKEFIFHPLAAQTKTSTGATKRKVEGTNLTFGEALFAPSVDRESFFQSALVPSDVDVAGTVVFEATFRQVDAGSGNVQLNLSYNTFATPTDRDAALTALGPSAEAVPGTAGQEFTAVFDVIATTFIADREVVWEVKREGTDAVDTFSGGIALVRCKLKIPVLPQHITSPEVIRSKVEIEDATVEMTNSQYWAIATAPSVATEVELPPDPEDGQEHSILAINVTSGIDVVGNGRNIRSEPATDAATYALTAIYESVTVRYDATVDRWYVVN